MAGASGIVAAGSYLAQPLVPVIAHDLGVRPSLAGLMVTFGQIGYCVGLLLIAPLADLLENRRLGSPGRSSQSILLRVSA